MKEIKVYLLNGLTCRQTMEDKKPGSGSQVTAAATVAADSAGHWALGLGSGLTLAPSIPSTP